MDRRRTLGRRRFSAVWSAAAVLVVVAVAAVAPAPTVRADFSLQPPPPAWPSHRSRRSPPHASTAVAMTRHRRPVDGLATRLGRVAARVATTAAAETDDEADGKGPPPAADADENSSGVTNETTSEQDVATLSAVTEAVVTTVHDGVHSKSTEGYRCFKIKYTTPTPTPVTKQWSPKIKKCLTSPETNDTQKASASTTENGDVSATTADNADEKTETSVDTTGDTTADAREVTTVVPSEQTTACLTATICMMEMTTANAKTTTPVETTGVIAGTTAADVDVKPTSRPTDRPTAETTCSEDPSCTETAETSAITTAGSEAVPDTTVTVDNDNATETTTKVRSKGGKKNRTAQRTPRRRLSKSPVFHAVSASSSSSPSSRRTAFSSCERLIPSKCGTDTMAGLRKSIIAEFF